MIAESVWLHQGTAAGNALMLHHRNAPPGVLLSD
jgi:hypothetical protein